jgi:hypothetical protein
MNAQVAGKGGVLRRAARAAWVAPVAAAGFAFAAEAPGAAGDTTVPSVSVPTVSVPTVTVPQILPTTAPVTSDPPPATGAAPTSVTVTGATSAVTSAATTGTTVAGARLLANGTISVPVSSVRSPVRLVVVISLEPQTLRRGTETIRARVQVSDTRGYLVRGARVALRSVPFGKLAATSQRTSASDGRAGFSLRLKDTRMRNGSLSLIVSAADPAAPNLALASSRAHLSVRIHRSR